MNVGRVEAPPLASADASGVGLLGGIDTRHDKPRVLDLQVAFIARRTRLALPLARLVAELAFVGRAA